MKRQRDKVIKRHSHFFTSLLSSLCLFFSLSLYLYTSPALADTNLVPPATGYVNDFAHVLTQDQKTSLEKSLANYRQQSGNEIAVVFVKSLNGENIDDFTVRVFEQYKIGKKDKDNGILFLASIDDRKMRIEVGYGLESYLSDAASGRIIRDVIAPKFKQNDYYGGTVAGVQAIENNLGSTSPTFASQPGNPVFLTTIIKLIEDMPFLIFIIIGLPIYLFSYMSRTKSIWLGGALGLILGLFLGNFFHNLISLSVTTIISALLGLGLDWQLSKNYQQRQKSGKSTDFWSSGGGFWGGGIGGSGGGFGGFGGGGSGGGGSSGSW